MKRIGISTKVMLLVILPIVVLSISLSGVVLLQSKSIVTKQFQETFSLIIEDLAMVFEEKFRKVLDQTKLIISNNAVQRYLSSNMSNLSNMDKSYLLNNIEATTNSIIIANKSIDVIYIYDLKGNPLFGDKANPLDRRLDINTLENLAAKSIDDSVITTTLNKNKYILSVRTIRSIDTFQPIGYVQITCREDILVQLYKRKLESYEGVLYIYNHKNSLIASVNSSKESNPTIETIIKRMTPESFQETKVNGERMQVFRHRSTMTDWEYVVLVPRSKITEPFVIVAVRTFFVFLFLTAFVMGFSVFATRSITQPIKEISMLLQKVKEGDYSIRTHYSGRDELGELSATYNSMVEEINRLVNKVLKLELINQEIEIKAMQAQINPHFLYNTFEAINALAKKHNAEPVSRMIISLSKLMRASITDVRKNNTIADEIAITDCYLEIQRFRMGNKLQVYYEINEALLDHIVPKLTLEPIVENAIIHGFKEKEGLCILEITIYEDKENMVIEVKDNGNGMNEKMLNISGATKEGRSGMGLELVERRLRLIYNIQQAITIESSIGVGTTVRICVPKLKGEMVEGSNCIK